MRNIGTPLDETVTPVADPAGGNEPRYRETVFPGNYLVTVTSADGTGQQVPFCVRRDPDESRLAPLSAEQIAAVTKWGGLRFNTDPLSLAEGASKPIRYRPFWNYLLGLVALLFVAEVVCTHLLTKRRSAC